MCYDLRFPELYRALAIRGAQIIFVPSAFTAYTGAAHWETLLRARAIENKSISLPPISSAKARRALNPRPFDDRRSVGDISAELADGPGVINAEIDLDYLAKVRAELPSLKHRRL